MPHTFSLEMETPRAFLLFPRFLHTFCLEHMESTPTRPSPKSSKSYGLGMVFIRVLDLAFFLEIFALVSHGSPDAVGPVRFALNCVWPMRFV